MFIDERTLNKIHANLGESIIHGTFSMYDVIPRLLDVISDTPEYIQITMSAVRIPPSYAYDDEDSEWWRSHEANDLYIELHDLLNDFAPEGYYFGSRSDDDNDLGFWKTKD